MIFPRYTVSNLPVYTSIHSVGIGAVSAAGATEEIESVRTKDLATRPDQQVKHLRRENGGKPLFGIQATGADSIRGRGKVSKQPCPDQVGAGCHGEGFP